MTVPQTPDDQQPDLDEVPDPVKATEPTAEPAPDERDDEETTGPVVAGPGIGGATTTPMPPVPPVPDVGSGH